MKPALSIIIANLSGMPEIGWCLIALEKQQARTTMEVIVVEPGGAGEMLQKQFPWIRLLRADQHLTIPALHNAGLEQSQGEIVAILEDHEVISPGWCEAVLASHRAHPDAAAIAGPIDNGCTERILDWATFFCEYCRFMSPLQAGYSESVPGNNVAYKRRALEESQSEDRIKGFWESTIHPELLRRGYQFRIEPGLQVSHQKHFGFLAFLEQRYHYSRAYAGSRMQRRNFFFRIAYSLACLFLPVLLMQRILSCGWGKQRFRKELILSTPLLACFTAVWGIGEMVGSLFGAGSSLSYIR